MPCLTPEQIESLARDMAEPGEAAELWRHVEQCDDCRRELDERVANEEALRKLRHSPACTLVTAGRGASETPARSAVAASASGDTTISVTWSTSRGRTIDRTLPSEIGSVRLLEEIGRGGMGVVFEGWDDVLRRAVAVKFLLGVLHKEGDPNFDQFLAGARAEAGLLHPNIVAVHSAGVIEDFPYLVMDLINGPTLRQICERTGPLPLAAAVKVMWDVASGVATLHKRGLMHRDLKPANVLFDEDGRLFVTDFGLASLRRPSRGLVHGAGTPTYMSPEAFDGKASPQTDVYALGAMFFRILAGRAPFSGDLDALRRQHANDPLPLDEISGWACPSVIETLERATHKKEMFRYKTARHFQWALDNIVGGGDLLREGDTELKALVTRSIAEQLVETTARPSDTTPGSSYFERLSEIAAKKRCATAQPALSQGVVPSELHADPGQRSIARDVPCVDCGYSLRGLSAGGRCPECGAPITPALEPDRVLFVAEPKRVSRIVRGLALCMCSIGAWGVVSFGPVFLLQRWFFPAWPLVKLFALLLFFPAWMLVVGLFLSTCSMASTPPTSDYFVTRRRVRAPILAAVILSAGAAAAMVAGQLSSSAASLTAYVLVSVLAVGVLPLAAAFLVQHFGKLAKRIPDAPLARKARPTITLICGAMISCVVLAALETAWPGFTWAAFSSDTSRFVARPELALFVFVAAIAAALSLAAWLCLLRFLQGARRALKTVILAAVPFDALFDRTSEPQDLSDNRVLIRDLPPFRHRRQRWWDYRRWPELVLERPVWMPRSYWRWLTCGRIVVLVIWAGAFTLGGVYGTYSSSLLLSTLSGAVIWAVYTRVVFDRFKSLLLANEFLMCTRCACWLQELPPAHACPECGRAYVAEDVRRAWRCWFENGVLPNTVSNREEIHPK